MVSASASGSGGAGSNPGGVTWLSCIILEQVIHSQLLRPTKPSIKLVPASAGSLRLRGILNGLCGIAGINCDL